jgi:hypothetical protein
LLSHHTDWDLQTMRYLLLLLIGTCLSYVPAQAQNDVVQTSLDVLYMVDAENDTTTAIYSLTYVQQESPARWVFPIPTNATSVNLIDGSFFNDLENATDLDIDAPLNPCELSYYAGLGDGYPPLPLINLADAEPLVRLDNSDDALEWLGQSNDSDQTLLQIDSTLFSFVGVESRMPQVFTEPFTNASISLLRSPTLQVTYPGTDLRLPIVFGGDRAETHLTNYDDEGQMPVTVYILADHPYVVQNYSEVTIDLNQIDSGYNLLRATIRRRFRPSIISSGLDPQYHALVKAALKSLNDRGFVTEFRLPDDDWDSRYFGNDIIQVMEELESPTLANATLTRMRTYVTPETVLPAPVFVPRDDASPFVMDLGQLGDSVKFWGCSSRWLMDPELEARLPSGRTYIELMRQSVAHPEDWVMTQLSETVFGFAPVPIDWDMVANLEYGGDEPPMLLLEKFELPYGASLENPTDADYYDGRVVNPAFNWFRRVNDPIPQGVPMRNAISVYWPTWNGAPGPGDSSFEAVTQGIRAVVMAPVERWAEYEPLLNDILLYLTQYQYFTAEDSRHTLFLGDLIDLIQIGYPDGWIETVDADQNRYIYPDGVGGIADKPYIFIASESTESAEARLSTDYNLTSALLKRPVPFEAGGRTGFILKTGLSNDYSYPYQIIEISVLSESYSEYEALLEHIAHSIRVCFECPQ